MLRKLLVGAWQRDNHLLYVGAVERSVLPVGVEAWRRAGHLLGEVSAARSVLPVGMWRLESHLLGEVSAARSVLPVGVEAWLRENYVLHEPAVERSVLLFANYPLSILKLNLILSFSLFVSITGEGCARESDCKSTPLHSISEMHYLITISHLLLYNPPPFSLQSHK